MMKSIVAGWFGVLLLLAALVPALPRASAEESDATPVPGVRTYSLYFLRDGKLGVAHRETDQPEPEGDAHVAFAMVLAGPTDAEKTAGLSTAIPEGAEIISTAGATDQELIKTDMTGDALNDDGLIDGAVAAQIVFTVTQFPKVKEVELLVDGEPVPVATASGETIDGPFTRDDFEAYLPLVFVESTAPGDEISSPLTLTGSANTFEASFVVEILDADGNLVVQQPVTATSGNGFRGTFETTIDFPAPATESGFVVAYEIDARDGGRNSESKIPVTFAEP
jgi:hypothetical protein